MPNLSAQERLALTEGIMRMLDHWGLSAGEVIKILALPGEVRSRQVARYRNGTPFPDDPQVFKRIEYLIRIADALRTYFPRNPEMRAIWMRRGNRKFGRKAPLALMVEGGESGLIRVLSHLDCTFAWDCTGSKAKY